MLGGILNSKCKCVKNPCQRQQALFSGAMKSLNLASNLYKNCCSKPIWAFVEVVEGSEMSKFGFQTLVHFRSNIWSKCWSNSVKRNFANTQNASTQATSRLARVPMLWTPHRGPHGRHTVSIGESGGAPIAVFPRSSCATRVPTPCRSANRDAAVPDRTSPPTSCPCRNLPSHWLANRLSHDMLAYLRASPPIAWATTQLSLRHGCRRRAPLATRFLNRSNTQALPLGSIEAPATACFPGRAASLPE
jgi:hypothetical protein